MYQDSFAVFSDGRTRLEPHLAEKIGMKRAALPSLAKRKRFVFLGCRNGKELNFSPATWRKPSEVLPHLPGQHVSATAGLPEKRVLVPVVPSHIFGKKADWCALQFANPEWPKSEDMKDFCGLAKLILEQTTKLLDDETVSVTVQYHKLDAEEMGKAVDLTKHCGRKRPAICLSRGNNGLVKLYTGMITRPQSHDVVSGVVTVKDLACMAQLLAALVDATETVPNALKFCAQGIRVYCKSELPDDCRAATEEDTAPAHMKDGGDSEPHSTDDAQLQQDVPTPVDPAAAAKPAVAKTGCAAGAPVEKLKIHSAALPDLSEKLRAGAEAGQYEIVFDATDASSAWKLRVANLDPMYQQRLTSMHEEGQLR